MQPRLDNHGLARLVRIRQYLDIKINHIIAAIIRLHNIDKILILFLLGNNSIGIPRIIPEPELANASTNIHFFIRLCKMEFEMIETHLREQGTGFAVYQGQGDLLDF